MNTREALQALLDDKKVRFYKWGKSEYIEMEKGGTKLHDEAGDPHNWNLECFDSFGWELYEDAPVLLTPEDVGKKVLLENGYTTLLLSCDSVGSQFFSFSGIYDRSGKDQRGEAKWSVKEVLK